ncbi:hypothetical protein [Collimonas sp. OK607]|nr:hypothetical protein [Collimonas sp. OK607]
MSDLSPMRLRRLFAICVGWLLLAGLLAVCFRAYLQPDFLLDLISGNLLC